MHPLPSYFCNYFKRRKLISHLGNKEGSWLLSWIARINMNSDMQTPEECNNANADWKEEIAALLARCDRVLLRWWSRTELLQGSDKPGWQKCWMKPGSSIRQVYTKNPKKDKKPNQPKPMSSRDDPWDQPLLPCFHFCDHIWNTNFSFISLTEK